MTGFSILKWRKEELGWVVAVVAVVAVVSLVQLRVGEIRARDAQRKADAELVARSLQVFYEQHGFFPEAEEGKIVSCGDGGGRACEWGTGPIIDSEGVKFLQKLPRDPWFGKGWRYKYWVEENGQKFKIFARLENARDADVKGDLTSGCSPTVQCNWYVEN